jgi:hypothetical protein
MNPIVEIARQCRYKSFQGINMLYFGNKNIFHTRSDGEFDDALNDIDGILAEEEDVINIIRNKTNGKDDMESILGAIRDYLNDERDRRYKEDLEKAEDMILN